MPRFLVCLITVLMLGLGAAIATATPDNPLGGAPLTRDRASAAAQALADAQHDGDARAAAAFRQIAAQPQAFWMTGPAREEALHAYLADAAAQHSRALIVVYGIPDRDCGLHSAGGSTGEQSYQDFIRRLTISVQGHEVAFILEPDALAAADCLDATERALRYRLLRRAIRALAPSGPVYLDAGNPGWHTARKMARRVRVVGLGPARGISLNVSHFHRTAVNRAYGRAISRELGRPLHLVIDTSRNGAGAPPRGTWCNPDGVRLGAAPRVLTSDPLVDALLWIKRPGESDGSCGEGPPAGLFWPEQALSLAG